MTTVEDTLDRGRLRATPGRPARPGPSSDQPSAAPAAARARLPRPVFFYLLAILLPLFLDVGPVLLSTVRVVLLVLIVPMTLNLLKGAYGRLLWTDIFFFVHTAWIAFSLSQTEGWNTAISQTGSAGLEFIGGYLMGRAYIRDAATFRAMMRFLVTAVLVLFPFAVLEAQMSPPLMVTLLKKIPVFGTIGDANMDIRLGMERVQSVFPHPIHYGLFCSSIFSLVLIGLKGVISDFRRWLMVGIVGLSVFLSLSSGAILPIVMQSGLFVWSKMTGRIQNRWWLLIGLTVVAYVAVDLLSNRTPIRVFMSYATFSPHNAFYRGVIFDWGYDNIMGNAARGIPPAPLFGIGLGDWVRPDWMHSSSVDNFWLVIGLRYGVPGVLTLAIGYGLMVWRVSLAPLSDPALMLLRRAWVFTFVGLTFTLCTVHIWTAMYSYTFFLMGAGAWFLTAAQRGGSEAAPEGDAEMATEALPARRSGFARPAQASAYTRFAGRKNG